MSINVGDAVLTFLGDTTNLDQAFDRVNSTSKEKLQPVSNTIQEIGGQWQFTGQAASTAGDLASIAGDQIEEAGHKSSASIREATATVGLLGEATGVTLPRHVRTFIASIGGVAEILDGAFAATAVFFLIEALVKGTEKLTEWVSETFVFTEAMQAVNAISGETNKQIAAQVDELTKLKDAYALVGLQGSALTVGQFGELSRAVADSSAKMRDFQNEIFGVRNGVITLPEAIDNVNSRIRELFKDLPEADLQKKLLPDDATQEQVISALSSFVGRAKATIDTSNEQLATIQKNFDAQTLAEQISTQEARIAATKATGDAQINLELQLALARNAQLKNAYGADEQAQIDANNAKYQNALSTYIAQRALADQKLQNDKNNLEVEKSLIAANDPQSAEKVAAIDQEILSVERQHAASIISIDSQIVEARKQHSAQVVSDYRQMNAQLEAETKKFAATQRGDLLKLVDSVNQDIPTADTFNPWRDGILAVAGAYGVLGIEGVVPLTKQLYEQRTALDQLYIGFTTGLVSKQDYLRASLVEINTEIALAKALGNSTKELERQRDAIKKQIPDHKQFGQTVESVAQQVGNAIDQEAFAFGQGAATIGQALRNVTASIIQEVAKQAEVKGAAKLAEALGEVFHDPPAAAGDFASAAAWFALAGGISALAGFTAGSGSSGSSGSDGSGSGQGVGTISTSPVGSSDATPVGVTNTQRFAVGGFATRQVLIGDSIGGGNAREAIIPIDDDRATGPISDALSSRFGKSSNGNHFHFPKVKGVVDIKGVMKNATRAARRGQGRLTSSDSLRLTRRG